MSRSSANPSVPESAVALRDALRRGEVSAREAVEHFLARIADRSDLGAFVAVTAEQALAEADAADERFAALSEDERAALPPLHGLPIAHKDLVDVTGAPTTMGSAALPHPVAERDHPGVAVLRAAGAVSLGKTQVPELGLNAYSENLIAAPARNPLDPERTAGGSSGGSAAAVAAGLLPVAPGSDGGGSIRIPSLACGLIGLKPGLGAVPTDLEHGPVDDFGAPRLPVTGPIARSAEDAALLFDAMAGSPGTALAAVRAADGLRDLRIGVSAASPFETVHPIPLWPGARLAWETAAERLAAAGHRVEAAGLRYDPRYAEAFGTGWMAGLSLLELAEGAQERLIPYTRVFRERALARSRDAHLEAASALQEIAADLRRQWGAYDVVLTPGLTMPPPRVGAFLALDPDDDYRLQCEWAAYTSMVNVSGLPAIAVPILDVPNPTGSGTLSMGAQLIGRAGSEAQLLQLAAQLTRATS
ncbi:amidase [Leucobacter triazinivorans]|uniref:Amidase n=1 Tax=Leucobacter triazinivorans TaxID=1784719 RepID=A0A4P6KFC5_9MICO|nr:amidase [Leucobacter triazinivorans]QBE49022.1 amidase [Leucobacter triazinivorans]